MGWWTGSGTVGRPGAGQSGRAGTAVQEQWWYGVGIRDPAVHVRTAGTPIHAMSV